ncbi:nucleotidyltransferase domain-containing protein [Yasminevirus sp. GU-2018]|uniref:Nucleotidyltransferase domain-containing protein n=1 Tax=Yasminevirus sp. GU-2018 TaxID=2420051 RepID=A0A5K0U9N0_9VIRU|nr:nucleotidyltransferase domain-containing protein [Yasminevirus sp. GU-2018]
MSVDTKSQIVEGNADKADKSDIKIVSKSPYVRIPDHLYQRILAQLKDLETSLNIEILLAIENGSRLTGLNHDESDCDIRFVFRYRDAVLNSVTGRELIDAPDTLEGFSSDKMLDWQGWCVDKAIKSLKSSNPSIIEWLNSDVIYISVGSFREDCRAILNKMHNVKSLYYHYLNMAKKNWDAFIKDKQKILYKKYLYVLRPLLMLVYIQSDDYATLKESEPVINDFYRLLTVIESKKSAVAEYNLNPELLVEVSLLIQFKQTDKTFEGAPLKTLDTWISAFFEYEQSRVDAQPTSKSDTLVFQALNSTREKVMNEYRKIVALSGRSNVINRNDYLSLFGQYTMYIWLIQHPGKHSGEAPQNIMNLIKEIDIDPGLSQWISEIATTKTEMSNITVQETEAGAEEGKSSDTAESTVTKRIDHTVMFLKHLREFVSNVSSMGFGSDLAGNQARSFEGTLGELSALITTVEAGDSIVRDDLIEFCHRHYLSLLWLINSKQNARNLPKDVFSDKDFTTVVPKTVADACHDVVTKLKPKYMVRVDKKYHAMIEADLSKYSEYVNTTCAKYGRKKEIDKQAMFKGSFQSVDPKEFLVLSRKYTL